MTYDARESRDVSEVTKSDFLVSPSILAPNPFAAALLTHAPRSLRYSERRPDLHDQRLLLPASRDALPMWGGLPEGLEGADGSELIRRAEFRSELVSVARAMAMRRQIEREG